jgi:hypothetical protein
MWGGMFLFSVFLTFIVSWSPGMTILWVAILTTSLLTLPECRTQAKNIFKRTLLKLITFADRKLGLNHLDDLQGGGEQRYESPSPECLKLNVTAKDKHHPHTQRKLAKQDGLWNKDIGLLHKISVAHHKDGREWLYVGPIDDPRGRIPVLVSNCSVHSNARRTSSEGKRGSAPSQDSEEENPESRRNGVDRPEASAPWIEEQVLKTPPTSGKPNSKGPKVKTDSRGPSKKTKKQNAPASPPKQKVKKPSERKSLQPQEGKQEPLGNEAKTSAVEDKVQAHLRWRSALFEPLNYDGLTNPGKEIQPLPPFPWSILNMSNVLERPVMTTKIDNAIWKYTIGQSVIL